jgi:apolipoprotein N-acyltransferase
MDHRPAPAPPADAPPRFAVAVSLASLAGVLTVSPMLYEPLWPLAWVGLLPLFVALRGVSAARAFALGWWTETLMYGLGTYWLVNTMVDFGYIPLPLSLVFFVIVAAANGVRMGLFAWWVRRMQASDSPWWYRLLLPPCAFVALDFAFPRVFPWYLGFLQYPALPLIQVADLTGIHGVSFMLVLCSAGIAAFVAVRRSPAAAGRYRMAVVVGCMLLLQVGYGLWRTPQVARAMQQAESLRVALVQPNLGIDENRNAAKRREHLRLLSDMSAATLMQEPDLVIWPESAYPFFLATQEAFFYLPNGLTNDVPWLVGGMAYDGPDDARRLFNSTWLVAPGQQVVGRYDKHVLLAFGEYVPMQRYLPFLGRISPAIGNFTPGDGPRVLALSNGVSIGPLICYEDIMPHPARLAVSGGAQVLVNLTNDMWFGPTRAPYQHRNAAAFRAVENRRSLVRVTNTGVTAVIDAMGREQAALPIYQRGTLVDDVTVLQMSTFYQRFGDWFAWLCCAAAVGLPGWQFGRRSGGRG